MHDPFTGAPSAPSPDARLESLAEACGLLIPEYEQSLPPEMRYSTDVDRQGGGDGR